MSFLILVLHVLTAVAFVVVASVGRMESDMKAYFLHLQKTLDVDADGIINGTEFINGFLKHDNNEDGRLDQSEFNGFIKEHNRALLPVSNTMFYLFDVHATKFIEKEDVAFLFVNMDIDDNGKIEADEIKSNLATISAFLVLLIKSI